VVPIVIREKAGASAANEKGKRDKRGGVEGGM